MARGQVDEEHAQQRSDLINEARTEWEKWARSTHGGTTHSWDELKPIEVERWLKIVLAKDEQSQYVVSRERVQRLEEELATLRANEHEALLEALKQPERLLIREVRPLAGLLENLPSDRTSAIKDGRRAPKRMRSKFDYPEPNKEAELTAIQERSTELAHVSRTIASLSLEGADVQVQIVGLHELAGRCEELARHIGMHAVSEGTVTQRGLSKLLGVHELTVHRWVKAAQEQQDQ